MIFTAEETRLILAGRKTQARRLAVRRRGLPAPCLERELEDGTTRPTSETEWLRCTTHRVGRVYPLERHARGDEVTPWQRVRMEQGTKTSPPVIVVAQMRCTSLRLQRLGDVSLRDARAEGFRTTDEFKVAWAIRRVRRATEPLTQDEIAAATALWLEAFDTHCAGQLVWAFEFEIVESPRLLKASASFDDYTDKPSKAARGEPEALTEDQLVALTRFRPAADDARRRQPLVTHAHNMARELDAIRDRMPHENLVDRDVKRTIRQIHLGVERLKEKLGAT